MSSPTGALLFAAGFILAFFGFGGTVAIKTPALTIAGSAGAVLMLIGAFA